MQGPGKYDEICTFVRTITQAEGTLLIVLNGSKGSGFSVQVPSQAHGRAIVQVLRDAAAEIEKDLPSIPVPHEPAT